MWKLLLAGMLAVGCKGREPAPEKLEKLEDPLAGCKVVTGEQDGNVGVVSDALKRAGMAPTQWTCGDSLVTLVDVEAPGVANVAAIEKNLASFEERSQAEVHERVVLTLGGHRSHASRVEYSDGDLGAGELVIIPLADHHVRLVTCTTRWTDFAWCERVAAALADRKSPTR